jgi:hypothetical protein
MQQLEHSDYIIHIAHCFPVKTLQVSGVSRWMMNVINQLTLKFTRLHGKRETHFCRYIARQSLSL